MTPVFLSRPPMAALADKVLQIMDVILHIGAQRTATTSFQAYLRANSADLSAQGVGYWGPHRTRRGGILSALVSLQDGVAPHSVIDGAVDETRDVIARYVSRLAKRGKTHLIVSDENMLGTARDNVRAESLYPRAAERLDRFARVFDGIATRVVLSVRSFETYWPSALAFSVGRGGRLPDQGALARIVAQKRTWRDVIGDVARAFPEAKLHVDGHEDLAGRPERRLAHMLDGAVVPPTAQARLWLNRSPDLAQLRAAVARRGGDPEQLPAGEGRWLPFDALQCAKLRENYADDLFWLHAGADGLATFHKEDLPDQTGTNLSGGATTRGQQNDRQDGRLARSG